MRISDRDTFKTGAVFLRRFLLTGSEACDDGVKVTLVSARFGTLPFNRDTAATVDGSSASMKQATKKLDHERKAPSRGTETPDIKRARRRHYSINH